MAGIGFQLKKILSDDSYTATLKAYAYSSLITSGPMIITIIAVAAMHLVTMKTLTAFEENYMRTLIMYGFAFSLIGVGPMSLVVTRYVADEYYRKHVSNFTAIFFSSLTVYALVMGPVAFYYFYPLSVSWAVKINAVLLFLLISGIWIAMIFLSAAQNYGRIVSAFAWGGAVGLAASYWLGGRQGFSGYFLGFAIGQGVIFILLSLTILKEFGYKEARDYDWIGYFSRYPLLFGIGLVYNVGIWIDKICFWTSVQGVSLDLRLYHSPIYDGPMFFAFLSSVPSMAYFLIQMETDFFTKYQAYYQAAENRETLKNLEKRRVEMLQSLEQSLKRLLIFQSVITGCCLLAAPWIAQAAGMDPLQTGVLRTGILANFLQTGYFILLNILLYFNFQKQAFLSTVIYCGSNFLFTVISIRTGLPAYGFGFLLACLVAFAFTFYCVNAQLRWLHYWTFMRQPLPKPVPVLDNLEEA